MADNADERFKEWFVDVLAVLNMTRGGGFAVVMLSLALLERYLREKSGAHEQTSLPDSFYSELLTLFPKLASIQQARKFWKVYRHGLLHQVAFSEQSKAGEAKQFGGLCDSCDAISVTQEGHFWVDPAKFSERVVSIIKDDFSTFLGEHSPKHPLPIVGQIGPFSAVGTAAPEMWKEKAFQAIKKKG